MTNKVIDTGSNYKIIDHVGTAIRRSTRFAGNAALGVARGITHPVDAVAYLTKAEISAPFKDHRTMQVDSYHLSCRCDPFHPTRKYLGILIYDINGKTQGEFAGVRFKSGYIYIREDVNIQDQVGATAHEKLCRSLFSGEMPTNIDAMGFAYKGGEWRFVSGTFNLRQIQDILGQQEAMSIHEIRESPRQAGMYERLMVYYIMKTEYENGVRNQNVSPVLVAKLLEMLTLMNLL